MRVRDPLLAALLVAAGLGPPLYAQSIVVRRTFGEVSAGYRGLQISQPVRSTSDTELFGSFGLRLEGHAISRQTLGFNIELYPSFVRLGASGYGDIPGGGRATELTYSGTVTAFPKGRMNVTLWGSRSNNDRLTPFGYTQDGFQDGLGATIALQLPVLPMQFYARRTSWQRSQVAPEGRALPILYGQSRRELGFNAANSKLTARIRRTWTDFLDAPGVGFFETFVSHQLKWGKGSSLRSRFNHVNRIRDSERMSAGIAGSFMDWRQDVLLRQANTLSTQLGYRFFWNSSGLFRSNGWEADITPRWRINRQVHLTATAEARHVEASGFRSSDRIFQPGVTGTFRLPGNGTLRLGGRLGILRSSVMNEDPGSIPIFGESHAIGPTRTFVLDQPNVELTSIEITSQDGTSTYFLDADYRLAQVGSLTQVEAVIGGRIEQGATVSVTYRYRPPELDSEVKTLLANYHGSIRFGRLQAYVQGRSSSGEKALATEPSSSVGGRDEITGGLQYVVFVRYISLNLFGEYTSSSSRLDDYQQYAGGAALQVPVSRTLQFGLGATARAVRLSNLRDRDAQTAYASLDWEPNRHIKLTGGGSLNRLTEVIPGDGKTRWDFAGGFANITGNVGSSAVTVSYSYGSWDQPSNTWSNSRLQVEVRRRF